MKEEKFEEILNLLENHVYVEVLLAIIGGKNYASSIARYLKKKQPTVTEQLNKLEALGLVIPLKRSKSKKYDINWRLLLKIFYDIIGEIMNIRKEYIKINIKKTELRKIIPENLIKAYLKEYLDTLLELGGKRKGFDEIIFTFFAAINHLEKDYWEKLVNKFDIKNKKKLSFIAKIMESEIYNIEYIALTKCLLR